MQKLTVVIPTFNESKNIVEILRRMADLRGSFPELAEVVVVDDDSPDFTWKIAEDLAQAEYPWVRVLRRAHARGLASAIIDGFNAASCDFLLVLDGDLQHDEKAIPKMFTELRKGAEIVVASRKISGGGIEQWSMPRKFASWCATILATKLLRVKVSDPMSGFFAIRRDLFYSIVKDVNPLGFKLLLELLFRAKKAKVAEVGYVFKDRAFGESKFSLNVILDYLEALISLRFYPVLSPTLVMYCCVGFAGLLVNLVVVFLLGDVFRLPKSVALFWSIEASILFNFFGNNFFTFRSKKIRLGWPMLLRVVQFNSICASGRF